MRPKLFHEGPVEEGSKFSIKEENKYFRLHRPYSLCSNYHFWNHGVKTTINIMQTNRHGSVPIKFYFKKHVVHWIWHLGRSLPTLALRIQPPFSCPFIRTSGKLFPPRGISLLPSVPCLPLLTPFDPMHVPLFCAMISHCSDPSFKGLSLGALPDILRPG